MSGLIKDPDFQDKLVAHLCRDRKFLREVSHLLEPEDFHPTSDEGTERWVVAHTALVYYRTYRDRIGTLLRAEMVDFAKRNRYSEDATLRLLAYIEKLAKIRLTGSNHLVEKIVGYKQDRRMLEAVERLSDLQVKGELTPAKWMEIAQFVTSSNDGQYRSTDFFTEEEIERRMLRRQSPPSIRDYPLLFIDPLDESIRAIGKGHLGMLMAPYKRGKSLGLLHIAHAYAIQRLRSLFFTLEVPLSDVEDRLDAQITQLEIKELSALPKVYRQRIDRFRTIVSGRIKIIDGTEGGMTVGRMIEIYERERNQGFHADAVFIDYDDEIVPGQRHRDRRMEFADIYRELRQFLSRNQLIGWTAAQTQRNTENRKIIGGDTIAEDISKVRKVALALGLGHDESWGEDSIYLFVAAHTHDRKHVGWNIKTDFSRMVFYDQDATKQAQNRERRAVQGGDDDDF